MRETEREKGGRKERGDMETLLQGPSGGDLKESEIHREKVFVRGSNNSF